MSEILSIHDIKEAAKDGTILGVQCENEHRFAEPKRRCPTCGSKTWEKVELPATGTVETFTIQNVASEEFMNDTPFAWAIIKLDDGTRIGGWVPYVSRDEDLALGQKVEFTPAYKPGLMFEKR